MVQFDCIRSGKKYFNRAGTKMRPEIDEKKVETLVVIDHEIQRLMEKFKIEQDAEPTKKNLDRKVNLINSEPLAKILENKGKKVRSISKKKLYDKKLEGIAKLCMVTVDKVKDVVKS